MIDVRFPTALQMMIMLAAAWESGTRCTSTSIAKGLGANPVLVRKLAVPLARDGIIVSSAGKNGGVRLARPPEDIDLKEIYLSVTEDKRLLSGRPNVPNVCFVSANISSFFDELSGHVETTVLDQLSRRTVSDSLKRIREIDALRGKA